MTMYTFPFEVRAEFPSGDPQYNGSKLVAERRFLVQCGYAEQLALRMLGKFYLTGSPGENYTTPVLPAPWPKWDKEGDPLQPNLPYSKLCQVSGRLNMIAKSFRIEPITGCCFNATSLTRTGELENIIEDPTAMSQMERNFAVQAGDEPGYPYEVAPIGECYCRVIIQYEERPWDCQWPEVDILKNTAISVERQAGYEMYTLPNRNLEWKNLPEPDKFLKGDTYATVIVPKADITVYWYNIPVTQLCKIDEHLKSFRGKVNEHPFELLAECLCESEDGSGCDSAESSESPWNPCSFEEETLMFIDYSEDLGSRTRGFHKMNTTTLKLHFKQKRVSTGDSQSPIAGWNHLYLDRDGALDFVSGWQRVVKKIGAVEEDLFPKVDFDNILSP